MARTVRHFFPQLNAWLDQAPDPRCPRRITYPHRFLLWYGILLFVGKLGCRRQLDFKYRQPGTCVRGPLNRLAQTDQDTLPCNDTLDDYLAQVGAGPLAEVRAELLRRLIRMRALDPARVQGRFVVAVAGSGYLTFRRPHCPHCLTRQCGEHVLYSQQVLEAKLLGPAEMALSLGSQFIDNRCWADSPPPAGAEKRKQDGALKASRRLFQEVRRPFPQLRLCQTGDALYAGGAGFATAKEYHTSFVFVFKAGSIPALWREFEALLALCPENRLETRPDGWRHVYRWVDELPSTDSDRREWKLRIDRRTTSRG